MCNKYIIALVVLIAIAIVFIKRGQTEHFETGWNPLWVGQKAKDCYSLGPNDCLDFENCGICRTGSTLQCVPGDTNGPYFKENCNQWMHTNFYDRHIFGEKVTTITPSWDQFAPEWEAKYPSPIIRATLQ